MYIDGWAGSQAMPVALDCTCAGLQGPDPSMSNMCVLPGEVSGRHTIVAGGAGFVGSHLVDRLMHQGHFVTVLDNFFTGDRQNIEQWNGHPHFAFIQHDVSNPIYLEADEIYHLASPASPPNYMTNPIKTLKANLLGSINLLGLARRAGATFLFASSSEVYGDPMAHPQSESYWGNVNPNGLRSCYDEGKRAAESLAYAYLRREGVPIRVARIFNTYGPRMQFHDGRVVSNFILQALSNQDICLYGDGSFTRSFMYVSDLVDGLIRLMNSNVTDPVNLGNPHEFRIQELADIVKNLTESSSKVVKCPEAVDDPKRRKPDIARAKNLLGWEPKVQLWEGLRLTVKAFRESLHNSSTFHRSEQYLLHGN
ncbi:UDP-glucuronic acid decarboxylase [Echinococcus granulosus]|uniref:UDP-glucuronic acid decarboxylase 1 n=2 Tax=Echinococcus granulosus TaxID=6210 RepID=W6UVS5_ECHGR|nr:UDP-glucuronic acid decarboxylase [Echinococcus granulosus]EUB62487.1 UDP-glucuronic acid decarboxylase [Echinococcus granulosus]